MGGLMGGLVQIGECLGGYCNLGEGGRSLFRCSKKALQFRRASDRVIFWCTYLNDYCIGAKCQFAYCEARAMDSQGRCLYAAGSRGREVNLEEELKKIEAEASKLEKHLRKLGLKDYI